jgi:hypothetical protein
MQPVERKRNKKRTKINPLLLKGTPIFDHIVFSYGFRFVGVSFIIAAPVLLVMVLLL